MTIVLIIIAAILLFIELDLTNIYKVLDRLADYHSKEYKW